MRSKSMLAVLLLLFANLAFGQQAFQEGKTLLNVTGFEPGNYLLTVDASGRIEVGRVTVIEIGETPTDPIKPPPITPANRVETLRKIVVAIDDDVMAKNFTPLFQGLSLKSRPSNDIKSPQLYETPEQLQKAVTDSMDLFLSISGSADKWQPFRDALSSEWNKIAQEGGSLEAYAKLIDDAGLSLAKASNMEGAAFDIAVIFKILEIIGNPNLTKFMKIIAIAPLILSMFI
jgi:hypothetical protein